MRAGCTAYVHRCFECQISGGRTHGSWMGEILPLPPGPRHTWSSDLITGLGPQGHSHHVLTVIDCFSKFCLLFRIDDRRSATVATLLERHLFGVFGAPAILRTDNGTEFKGDVASLCLSRGTRQARSMPFTSHSNGIVERLHRTLETLLRRCLVTVPSHTWDTLLPSLQYTVNTTFQRSIGCPPFLLMFGTTPPSCAPSLPPDPTPAHLQRYAQAVSH